MMLWLVWLLMSVCQLHASTYYVFTYSGTGTNAVGTDNVKASASSLNMPRSVYGDTSGDVYIAEATANCIRRVDKDDGKIYEYAGSCGASGTSTGDNGKATSARINKPIGLYIDTSSNIYFTDYSGAKIRMINTANSIVSLVAGTGNAAQSSDGGVASSSDIKTPHCVWINTNGKIYFCELTGYKIRTITSSVLGTIVGIGSTGDGSSNIAGTSCAITLAERVYGTTTGVIYVADTNSAHKIRKLATSGTITTYAGTGTGGYTGDSVKATSTGLNYPTGMYTDPDTGDMVFSDRSNHRIRSITASSGIIYTFAGTGTAGSDGDGGSVASAQFNGPDGFFIDSTYRLYFACYYDYRVRIIYDVTPTSQPSRQPTSQPTRQPSTQPTRQPSCQPTRQPSAQPTVQPSSQPTSQPTVQPSSQPTAPSCQPTGWPSVQPSRLPTMQPSSQPSGRPSAQPSTQPSALPTAPTGQPTSQPSGRPSVEPSQQPSAQPTTRPTSQPSCIPTIQPSAQPIARPTSQPSVQPVSFPSSQPSHQPSARPTMQPTSKPTDQPSSQPSSQPSVKPSSKPTVQPSSQPSSIPTNHPSAVPTKQPTGAPSNQPSIQPTAQPSGHPSVQPTSKPTVQPLSQPSCQPTDQPSRQPSRSPTVQPTATPSVQPTDQPSAEPSRQPSDSPSVQPTGQPSSEPSNQPTAKPTVHPSEAPSTQPSSQPSGAPTKQPTVQPTCHPSGQPSLHPSVQPTSQPFHRPSRQPSGHPSVQPSSQPTARPTGQPSVQPSRQPSSQPISWPTSQPSRQPSSQPTRQPSRQPTDQPSVQPTNRPSGYPTAQPSTQPSCQPSAVPSLQPSSQPTSRPTCQPSIRPSRQPSGQPIRHPTSQPSSQPSGQPSAQPFTQPTSQPYSRPSSQPSSQPSAHPSAQPSRRPSVQPTASPTVYHTRQPTTMSEQLAYYGHVSVRGLPASSSSSDVKIVLPFVLSRSPPLDDGFRDVVVSSVPVGGLDYVVYSSSSNLNTSAVPLSSLLPTQGYSVSPVVSYDWSGRSLSNVGDFNGDGLDDLIIGVPYLSRCYVLFGTAVSGFQNLTLGFMVHGVDSADLTGWSVSGAGDVNQDGVADILIGAPRARLRGSDAAVRVGAAYVLFGSSNREYSNVFRDVYLDNLSPEEGFVMYGESAEDCFGLSAAAAGDVNGDGFDDVIVGSAKLSSFYSGGAYVVFGGSGVIGQSGVIHMSGMTASEGVSLVGETWSHSGFSVSGAGDVNNDGYDDVLVGCAPMNGAAKLSETSYLVYGFGISKNVTRLSLSPGVSGVVSLTGGGMLVSQLSVDINNDGRKDLLIGSNYSTSAGVGYVVLSGLFKYAPTARPSVRPTPCPSTRQPSVKPFRTSAPSAAPLGTPTRQPSVVPSRPTATPSVAPTGPTEVPTSHPSSLLQAVSHNPTSHPTSRPTCIPTALPTIVTDFPSSVPSAAPTFRATSVSPSLQPSIVPSIEPTSESPTFFPSLPRSVFSKPTLRPSIAATAVPSAPSPYGGYIEISGDTVYRVSHDDPTNGTSVLTAQYYVWSPLSSQSAYLAGRAASHEKSVIVVKPCPGCHLSVQYFNLTMDAIDLSAFDEYYTVRELNITGHYVITLLNAQVIHLLNMANSDVLSDANFRFAAEKTDKPASNHNLVLFGALFGSLAGLVFLVRYAFVYRKWRRDMKIANALIARQKPLVTHTHSLYLHTLIGKRHRPVLFEVHEEDREFAADNEDDSVLEHESRQEDSSDAATRNGDDGGGTESDEENELGGRMTQFETEYDADFLNFRQIQAERMNPDYEEEFYDYEEDEDDNYCDEGEDDPERCLNNGFLSSVAEVLLSGKGNTDTDFIEVQVHEGS